MKPPLRTKYDSTSSEPWASTGRLVGYSYNVNGQADTGTLAWNFWGSLGSLAIADGISGTSDSQTCDYGYDDLERLSGANCGSGWNQSFSYDAFGNQAKTASGGTQFNATFAVANNQIAEVGSYSPSYDANGNLLDDPVAGAAAYTWDADNHLHTVNGYTLVYDALGRVAEMQGGSSDAEVLYGPGGGKLALMNGNSSLTEAFLPLPGGATAVYNSSGLAYYRHPDMLGSSRLASTPARTLYSETAYGPDGEPYDTAGTADANFTGMNQDTVTGSSGLYDFLFRELSPTQGRWLSPDPAGIAAVDPSNPQTWNRYAYVAGNMLSNVDWLGLDDCVQPTTTEPGFARDTPPPCDPPGQQCSFDGGEAVPCNPGAGGSGSGGFVAGGSDACPDNDCTGVQASDDGNGNTVIQTYVQAVGISNYVTYIIGNGQTLTEELPTTVDYWQTTEVTGDGCGLDPACYFFVGFGNLFVNGQPSGALDLVGSEAVGVAAGAASASSALAGAASSVWQAGIDSGLEAYYFGMHALYDPVIMQALTEFTSGALLGELYTSYSGVAGDVINRTWGQISSATSSAYDWVFHGGGQQ